MFEIGIFSVIVLAVSYWAILWVMGRREDVLHGEFVKADGQPGEPVRAARPKPTVRPVFPDRSAVADRVAIPERSTIADRSEIPDRVANTDRPLFPETHVPATAPEPTAFRPERLEQLLASIKQDLNQLVQK